MPTQKHIEISIKIPLCFKTNAMEPGVQHLIENKAQEIIAAIVPDKISRCLATAGGLAGICFIPNKDITGDVAVDFIEAVFIGVSRDDPRYFKQETGEVSKDG